MNALLCLAVLVAAFVGGLAQRPHDPCRTCEIIVNIARHHFNNTVNDKAALQAQLLMECTRLGQFEGAEASAHCTAVVNAKIDMIYDDMHTQKTSRQTCTDIGECTPGSSMMPMLKREKRQRPHDPCRTCEIIVNIARHHFHNNVTNQDALKAQLLMECQHLSQIEGQAAADHCAMVVNNNIAQIFADMSTHKTARQTCQDIKECPMILRRQKRQAMHTPCRTCEIIIGIAKRHFHNNITDQGALQTQLDMECNNLANHGFNASEVAQCRALVDGNMPAIYQELVNNPTASPQKICTDLGQCTTMLKREKRQRPHDPCRTCDIVLNIARHHFHNNITDKAALQAQLLLECTHLGQFEGQEASAHCTQIVNNNMDKIYSDLSTGVSARQTCVDIKECPPRPSQMPALKREKRQRPHDPCRTCEIIVNIARHHFHNNVTNQAALQAQLLVECQHLVQTESQAAADHCKMVVNNNIAKIFADMSTNHTARQTCQDIKECPMKKLFVKRS